MFITKRKLEELKWEAIREKEKADGFCKLWTKVEKLEVRVHELENMMCELQGVKDKKEEKVCIPH